MERYDSLSGVLNAPVEDLEKVEGSPEGMGNEEIVVLSRIVRTAKHGLFIGGTEDKSTFWLYDWEKQEGIDLGEVEDDLIAPFYFMDADSGYFYSPSSVSGLKEMIIDTPEKYDAQTVETVKKLDEDANPVIFKIRVKPM